MSQAQEEVVIEQEQSVTPAATEAPVETPEIEVTDAEQEAETDPQPKAKAFDPKTDKVEFSTPEQQAKFNDQYKQTKMADARNAMLLEMNQKAIARIEELEKRFSNTDSAEAERILLGRVQAARNSGDDAAELAALNELTDFKVEKKLAEKANKPAPPVMAENSAEVQYISGMIEETAPDGTQLRPWMNNDHPDQAVALAELEPLKAKYAGDPYAIPKILQELDQVMKVKMTKPVSPPQPQLRAPNPLQGGNLTNVKQKTTIKMTRQELEIAKKLGVDPKRYAAERDKPRNR